MRTLDNIKSGPGSLCIPCEFCSGRGATIRMNINEPDKVHIAIEGENGRPYQGMLDSYLHINQENLKARSSYENIDEIKCAIALVNKFYFAGKLQVYSDDKEIIDRWILKPRTIKQVIIDMVAAYQDTSDDFYRDMMGWPKSNFIERLKNAYLAAKPQTERIQVVETIKSLHLGGTWQNYSADGWIDEVKALSDKPVYFA